MKKTHLILGVVCLAVMGLLSLCTQLKAETASQAARQDAWGKSATVSKITLSATQATQLMAASNDRPDATCFNNSSVYIYLSTAASGTTALNNGFPVASSSTFRLNGFAGAVYATLATGPGEARCWFGTNP